MSHTRNIVIIEDDQNLAIAMRTSLEGSETCVTVFDDAPSPDVLCLLEPDLLIVDCILQTTSGPDYLVRLQQDPALCKIPVLMTTGIEELAEALSEYRFLRKPFSSGELVQAVESIIAIA